MAKRPAEEPGETKEQAEDHEQDGGGKAQQQQAESEPKVKQVTFLDAADEGKDRGPKKEPRKRTRKIMHQLRTQMEFYFGDANVNKDRFMKEQVESDPEGYVPISVFMTFANINSVTTDTEILVKALKFSQFLQLNEDETKVRRTTPIKYMTQEETDARTVYVEGFHKFITREWIKAKFSVCGKVTYISLPRFKSTQEIKGYAFVEFETPEEAGNAIKMLNSVSDELGEKAEEKVAASVKQTKNLAYWKKRVSKAGIDPAEVEAGSKELIKEDGEEEGSKEGTKTRSRRKRKKNRPSVGQAESAAAADSAMVQRTDAAGSTAAPDEPTENTVKQEATSETEDTRVKKSKKSKKKHKRKSSLHKLSSEDSAPQNTGDANTIVFKPKESEQSVKTEAVVPKDTEDSINITSTTEAEKPKELGSQSSRKRHRSSEAVPDQSSAKVARLDSHPDKESKKGGEKEAEKESLRLKCTSLEGSQKVWELCETAPDGADCGKDSEPRKSSSRKRKRQTAEDSEHPVQQGGQSDTGRGKETAPGGANTTKDEQKSSSKKRKADMTDGSSEKTLKAKKQKDGKQGGQSRRSIEQTHDPAMGEGRKRKSGEGGHDGSGRKKRKSHAGSSSEAMSETEDPEGKRKRYRKHKLPEPDIRLRVMAKETWSQLKKEYLEQQKTNMRKLKDLLKEASRKRREEATNKQNNEQDAKGGHPPADFVPNVILEVKSEAELCLQTIKADIPPSVQVAYVDIRPGMTEGFIRCKDAESASKLLKTGLRGLTLSRMEGESELQYWNKLVADRQAKLSDTKRRKRRGKLKILQRAQNPQESNPRQHVIFADDDTDKDRTQNPANMRDDFNAYSYYHNAYKYPYLYRTPEKNDNRNTPRSMGGVYYPPY